MLLFLDIDGVLVPAMGWKTPELLEDGFPAFSKPSTTVLQRLITQDVTIMLTTSHKSRYSLDEWKDIFKNRGINIENIQSLPANSKFISRKQELINWFKLNQVDSNFVIIDDDKSLQDLPVSLKANLVQPSPTVGLNETHLELINSILRKDTPVLL